MAQVVNTDLTGDVGGGGALFEGMKIWLAQSVPQRQRFIQQVQANGGEVVPLEKNAHIKLVDHARNKALPGTYSYKFIEQSIRNGHLESLEDYAVGPPAGTTRTVGSITWPPKGRRTAFTAEDDRFLSDWVTAHQEEGGKTAGNEIYKQLEQKNSRHPWQAWRDRWIKNLQDKPRPAPIPRRRSPAAGSDRAVGVDITKQRKHILGKNKEQATEFSQEDLESLLGEAEGILNILPERLSDAWAAWAAKNPSHSAQQWRNFWESAILPLHMKREAKKAAKDNYETDQVMSDPRLKSSKPAMDRPMQTLQSVEMSSCARRVERSPSYQPKSPKLQVMKPACANQMNGNESRDGSLARDARSGTTDSESLFLPALEVLVESSRSPKRKRTAAEVDELPHSSPLKVMNSVYKRQRQASSQEPLEVPSTPEQLPRELGTPSDPGNGMIEIDSDDGSASDGLGMPASQSLSEPNQSARKSQTTFKDPTQYLNLGVVSPEGSWEENIAAKEESGKAPEIDETQPRTMDTQALLAGQTQTPDFLIPEPDGGWDDLMPSSPPSRVPVQSKTAEDAAEEESDTDTEENEADITARLDEWIDSHVAAGMETEDVALALKCTSMEADLAEEILPYLAKHKTIPGNVRGVWTEEDDRDLDAGDGRRIRCLQEKHGQEGFDARWEFLRIYRGSA
ncbi:TRF2-interacting telomeric protein/Rap1, C-terminal [Lasallia pustulata]|uniref:DNA-binding protein RAP1 n=1 Tax=Lasallia pustulata TaxID=136370 RepID=A0A1W5D1U3_9LECA|nr:TRF2-interacting telomeric protein/Rap1, C-terminal [Lasallia pustulata]